MAILVRMESESLHRLKKLKFKRELRKNMTPAECVLWQKLRNRKLKGTKWKRQEDIGHFIADFLCHQYRLIIEVDGGIHDTQHEHDRLRTEGIMDHGYRILRFKNQEVMEDLPSVLQRIAQAIDLTSQFPLPKAPSSPQCGEEVGR